ncbi:hypothetical protein GCM10009608_19170 [Pseudonocardia alaniniphila]
MTEPHDHGKRMSLPGRDGRHRRDGVNRDARSEERESGVGDGDPAPAVREQRYTQLPRQARDLPARCGLHHVQARGGAAEVQLLRHGDEMPEISELHVRD